ncbi:MAG: hypothetical protein IKM97_01270 [Clostridia bacterium]|nr:hypothetical protein [Clostridia bacterium]
MHTDYKWYGVLTVWIFYIFRKSKILKSFFFILNNIIYYLCFGFFSINNFFVFLFAVMPIILILLYNGKPGKKLKYFFYIFYPTHFFLLYSIYLFFIK